MSTPRACCRCHHNLADPKLVLYGSRDHWWQRKAPFRFCADCGPRLASLIGLVVNGNIPLPSTRELAYLRDRTLTTEQVTATQQHWSRPRVRLAVTRPRCGHGQSVERNITEPGRLSLLCVKCESQVFVDITAADLQTAMASVWGRRG